MQFLKFWFDEFGELYEKFDEKAKLNVQIAPSFYFSKICKSNL